MSPFQHLACVRQSLLAARRAVVHLRDFECCMHVRMQGPTEVQLARSRQQVVTLCTHKANPQSMEGFRGNGSRDASCHKPAGDLPFPGRLYLSKPRIRCKTWMTVVKLQDTDMVTVLCCARTSVHWQPPKQDALVCSHALRTSLRRQACSHHQMPQQSRGLGSEMVRTQAEPSWAKLSQAGN